MKNLRSTTLVMLVLAEMVVFPVTARQKAGTSVKPGAPVEFTYLGLTANKQNIHYRIKVLTDRPVEQVDIGVKYMDAGGTVLEDTTIIWQNIVKSKRLPIVGSQTYDVEDVLWPDAVKAECKLVRVVFKDFSTWSAKPK